MKQAEQTIQHHWRKYLLEGNQGEFIQVYELLCKQLILYCSGRFRSVNQEDAEDIVADTFITLLELDYHKKTEVKNVKAWLIHVIQRKALNLLTYRSIREEKKGLIAGKTNSHSQDSEYAIDHEHREMVKQISLESTEHKIWVMHNEGYKNEEIAEALQIGYQTVGNKLVKIRQKLNIGFKQLYFGNGEKHEK